LLIGKSPFQDQTPLSSALFADGDNRSYLRKNQQKDTFRGALTGDSIDKISNFRLITN
jgi:hypothetical protein